MVEPSLVALGIFDFFLEIIPAIFVNLMIRSGERVWPMYWSLYIDLSKAIFILITVPSWFKSFLSHNLFNIIGVKVLLYFYIFIITIISLFLTFIWVYFFSHLTDPLMASAYSLYMLFYSLFKLGMHFWYFQMSKNTAFIPQIILANYKGSLEEQKLNLDHSKISSTQIMIF